MSLLTFFFLVRMIKMIAHKKNHAKLKNFLSAIFGRAL